MIINANEKITVTLAAGSVLTVAAPSGTTGLVTRLSRMPGGGDAQSVTAINGANLTFGAYADVERFEIVCTAGVVTLTSAAYDPASDASDTELAAILATSIADSDVTHAPTGNAVFDALALKAPLANPVFTGAMAIPDKTPVNATGTTLAIPAADIAVLEAGDTVGFDSATFTMAVAPGAGEFSDAAGLAALIDALAGWTGAANEGAVSAVSVALGAAQNGQIATITHLGATTSGGSEVAKATGTIAAAEIARLAVGDQVTFDGATFTKAAVTSVPANEFADTAGLISCIDGMAAWTAAASGSDIKVDAAENGEASNGKAINLIYKRTSAGAVNGTVGVANETCADATNLYHCIATNTVAGANWRKVTLNAL